MPNQTNYSCAWNQDMQQFNASCYQISRSTHNELVYGTQTFKSNSIFSQNVYATYTNQYESNPYNSPENQKEVNIGYNYSSAPILQQNDYNYNEKYFREADSASAGYNTLPLQEEQPFCSYNDTNYGQNFAENSTCENIEVTDSESDIIVEESEDVATDYSEDLEQVLHIDSACCVCGCSSIGNRLQTVSSKLPLTVSSRVPVFAKISELGGAFQANTRQYLCQNCLGLVNTIDQLQGKLKLYTDELLGNLSKTKTLGGSFEPKCAHIASCGLCKKAKRCSRKRNFLCELCGRSFLKLGMLRLHARRAHKKAVLASFVKKIPAFCCRSCKKPFRTRSHLKEHTNSCLGLLPFKCTSSDCTKKFATITKLRTHERLKHEKVFAAICAICNVGFAKPSDYKSHMVSHSTEKRFHCPRCTKSYKTLGNLNFHMKAHEERSPHTCPLCKKGFMRKEYLEAHIDAHNGVKNFECPVCGKKFGSQKNLDAHGKYHEGDAKKKRCGICGKSVASGLEDHVRAHNNLKEFQCAVCAMKFNTKGALAKHKKRKHASEDPLFLR